MPRLKPDQAHDDTDKIISKMERKIAKEYRQAEKEVEKKMKKYLESSKEFKDKERKMLKRLADGEITQKEFNQWRMNQIATGERWKAMRDTLAEDLANANDIAKNIITGEMADVYSMNRNYSVFQAEKDALIDTSYTLYNREATEMLFQNDKSILPMPKEGTPAWKAMHDRDLKWNQKKINSCLIQGLLQGESNPQIAKRLREVVGMNKRAAIRNARTMTTAVENRGRNDAYDELKSKGVELEEVWIATLDMRTRHSHRLLYGEIKNPKTGKFSNGLRFPGDPQGRPDEVYNCRCSQFAQVKGFPIELPRHSSKMNGMSFEEWQGLKEDGKPVAPEKPYVKDEKLVELESRLKMSGVKKIDTQRYEKIPSQDEIIKKISGGDLTVGSCVSLAFTYAGNKGGIDVTDFRGGKSCAFFSRGSNIRTILEIADIKSTELVGGNDFKCANELLKGIAKDDTKEYILITGKHASVVRRNEGVIQYLELQSATENGYKNLTQERLRFRFGCQKSHSSYGEKYNTPNWLIDLDSLTQSEDFKNILPYLNTNEGDQRKGSEGYAK